MDFHFWSEQVHVATRFPLLCRGTSQVPCQLRPRLDHELASVASRPFFCVSGHNPLRSVGSDCEKNDEILRRLFLVFGRALRDLLLAARSAVLLFCEPCGLVALQVAAPHACASAF